MVRFEEAEGKSDDETKSGAYYRCFGDIGVAKLLSRVQSLIIKNGYELENIIKERTRDIHIMDLDEFLKIQIHEAGVRVAMKGTIKASTTMRGSKIEPDFIVFERKGTSQNCYIIELKDGHEFDTKSASKEHDNLHTFMSMNAMAIDNFQTYCKICGFNAQSRKEIQKGMKEKFALEQTMTGQELCNLLNLDYQRILDRRASDRIHNLQSIVSEFTALDAVQERLERDG